MRRRARTCARILLSGTGVLQSGARKRMGASPALGFMTVQYVGSFVRDFFATLEIERRIGGYGSVMRRDSFHFHFRVQT
jgi:hypothetical protein